MDCTGDDVDDIELSEFPNRPLSRTPILNDKTFVKSRSPFRSPPDLPTPPMEQDYPAKHYSLSTCSKADQDCNWRYRGPGKFNNKWNMDKYGSKYPHSQNIDRNIDRSKNRYVK